MELNKFFVKAPLVPVICQDERSGEVLMLGYADEEALRLTMETGTAWFFSRSRNCGTRAKPRATLFLCPKYCPTVMTIR